MMFLIELSHNRARVFRIELGPRFLMAITIVLVAYLTFKTVLATFAGFFSR